MTQADEVPHDEGQLNRRWGIGLNVAVRTVIARLYRASCRTTIPIECVAVVARLVGKTLPVSTGGNAGASRTIGFRDAVVTTVERKIDFTVGQVRVIALLGALLDFVTTDRLPA